MNILTFDTALDKTYISLSKNYENVENKTITTDKDKYHSAYLIQEIANLLKKHNLKMSDINGIGINIGPGSFTGIRACTTVGRIIAQQLNLPLIAVSSLEILSKINKKGEAIISLDARKNSAFIGKYNKEKEIISPQIITIEELIEQIKTCGKIICDTTLYNKLTEKNIKEEIINYEKKDYPLNRYLMEIVIEKFKRSKNPQREYNWAKVKPLYIQPPSVFGGAGTKKS